MLTKFGNIDSVVFTVERLVNRHKLMKHSTQILYIFLNVLSITL